MKAHPDIDKSYHMCLHNDNAHVTKMFNPKIITFSF